jgi:2'-5' RNA ligase
MAVERRSDAESLLMRYAIVVFPETDASATVEALRRRFDPLATMIPAHVTLVFPFEGTVASTDLRSHVEQAVADVHAFEVRLAGVSTAEDEYIFLGLEVGGDDIVALHERLYTGSLAQHLSRDHVYRPHITLGRLHDRVALADAVVECAAALPQPSRAVVAEVAVFRLDDASHGEIELTVNLAVG